jgi:glycosyltransferase involved in cell wall biosynthesis
MGVDVRMIEHSGIGTYIQNLLPLFIQNNKSIQFYLLGSKEVLKKYEWSEEENVDIINFEAPIYSIREQILFPFTIPKNLDLFWSPHYNIPLLYSNRLITTIHDILPIAFPDYRKSKIRFAYAKFMYQKAISKSDKIICDAEFTISEIQKYLKMPKEKATAIYIGVAPFWKSEHPRNPQKEKPYLLTVGVLKPHKNFSGLIKAFKTLEENNKYELVIVGDREKLKKSDPSLNEYFNDGNSNIKFTGFITNEELKELYSKASAFIFPSFYEGFGLPALEAMAMHCPVICSNTSSLVEIFSEAANCFNPYDTEDMAKTISNTLANPELQDEMVKKGDLFVEKLNWKSCYDKTKEVFFS